MLSIIISSYQPSYFNVLEKNIKVTCGVEYEIIRIKNPNLMGICQAYNLGASKSKYNNLLFVHEDVIFHTQNWGEILINYLKDKQLGVVGIAGSNYVPFVPSNWWVNARKSKLHLIQSNKNERVKVHTRTNFEDNRLFEYVYSLDGVFMACRKDVYKQFKFNDKIKGFHAYDVDFSLRIAAEYKNIVTGEILIEHFSEGNADKVWFQEMIKARRFYKLPKNQKNNKEIELRSFKTFLLQFKIFNITKGQQFFLALKYLSLSKVGFVNVLKLIYSKIK
ncbi:glycosyltransferase [Olleya sp. HaHaR_3_96]|uniref:glycosyltransferase n=1 Tax=Olleya sp. HaHaR_3_96 TaxID=2745560 RepID=UPI001C4ED74A|nr:glycosyltransferase [Olleya sp. HaHaR_3_96]QXP61678.1 hypothetical protein H0I26_08625 [Olleya sp. HaHaR_3_96]